MKLKLLVLLICCASVYAGPADEYHLPPDNTKPVRIYNKTLYYFSMETLQGDYSIRPISETIIYLSPQKIHITMYGPLDFTYSRPLNSIGKSISKYTKKLLLYSSDNKYGWEATTSFFPW